MIWAHGSLCTSKMIEHAHKVKKTNKTLPVLEQQCIIQKFLVSLLYSSSETRLASHHLMTFLPVQYNVPLKNHYTQNQY